MRSVLDTLKQVIENLSHDNSVFSEFDVPGGAITHLNPKRSTSVISMIQNSHLGLRPTTGLNERDCLASLYSSRLQCVSACHDLQGNVVDVIFEPSGNRPLILACSVTGNIDDVRQQVGAVAKYTSVLYNYKNGISWPLDGHGNNTVTYIAFAHNGERALTSGFDGNLCVWNVSHCERKDGRAVLENEIKCLLSISYSCTLFLCF